MTGGVISNESFKDLWHGTRHKLIEMEYFLDLWSVCLLSITSGGHEDVHVRPQSDRNSLFSLCHLASHQCISFTFNQFNGSTATSNSKPGIVSHRRICVHYWNAHWIIIFPGLHDQNHWGLCWNCLWLTDRGKNTCYPEPIKSTSRLLFFAWWIIACVIQS